MIVIGANPTDGASGVRLAHEEAAAPGREADRDRSAPHRYGALAACRGGVSPAAAARHQCRGADRDCACHRHRGARQRGVRPRALRLGRVPALGGVRLASRATARRRSRGLPAFRPPISAARRGFTPPAATRAIYYGLGVTEHSQGSTTVMAIANLAMATGNIGRPGVGVNPLRGQNNVQGSCDMGSFPHELSGYRHISGDATRQMFESALGRDARQGAGPAHPEHVRRGGRRHLQGALRAGRGHSSVRSEHEARLGRRSRPWNASWCRICS